jgi:hypothetical protein
MKQLVRSRAPHCELRGVLDQQAADLIRLHAIALAQLAQLWLGNARAPVHLARRAYEAAGTLHILASEIQREANHRRRNSRQ